MTRTNFEARRRLEGMTAEQLAHHQRTRLNALLAAILPHNEFYAAKLQGLELPLESLDPFFELPYTLKTELIHGVTGNKSRRNSIAANTTWEPTEYTRFHRTSGTHGRPLAVIDTTDDWRWWIETWQFVLDAAEVEPSDRVFLAFSFGPFIGFWSAFDAVTMRGAMAVPGGGMSTRARLDLLAASQSNVLCCTPTYALRMVEVAAEHHIDPASLGVDRMIVAGEPGGSVGTVRARIESAWNCRLIDHSGATEIGPWGYGARDGTGLHVVESEFLAEFRSVETGQTANEGELSELVITTLGRTGCPVIRYRTGDLVRPRWDHQAKNRFVLLDGGVIGRIDDMLVIRGVNIFPNAIEQILHGFPEVVEFRITARKHGEMDALSVEVEDRLQRPDRIASELKMRLGLNVEVANVPLGSLPRFEGKGRRFVDERGKIDSTSNARSD